MLLIDELVSMTPKEHVFKSLAKIIPWVRDEHDLNAVRDELVRCLQGVASWEPLLIDDPARC